MDLRIRELEGSSRVTTAQQHLVDALRNEVASLREDIAKVGREWQQCLGEVWKGSGEQMGWGLRVDVQQHEDAMDW